MLSSREYDVLAYIVSQRSVSYFGVLSHLDPLYPPIEVHDTITSLAHQGLISYAADTCRPLSPAHHELSMYEEFENRFADYEKKLADQEKRAHRQNLLIALVSAVAGGICTTFFALATELGSRLIDILFRFLAS